MIRITAVCANENTCPLYKKGAQLEFAHPAVTGVDNAPICAIAVQALLEPVRKIGAGVLHTLFKNVFCGGCTAGKAWWNFEAASHEDTLRISPAILHSLGKMKLFGGVPIDRLMRIVKLMKERLMPPGEIAIHLGKPGEAFFIVIKGDFEVVQHDENQVESTLATLPSGECFGEMSLFTGEPASATVRAKSASIVLTLTKEHFNTMLGIAPEIAITLSRILANRLAKTGRWVIDELKKGIMGRLELVSPAELIQAMNVNAQTGMLIVQNGESKISVYLHDGQVREVELGAKKGEEAFFEFLTWARGNFRFEPVRKDEPSQQVRMDTVGLLLEGMRRKDETVEPTANPTPTA